MVRTVFFLKGNAYTFNKKTVLALRKLSVKNVNFQKFGTFFPEFEKITNMEYLAKEAVIKKNKTTFFSPILKVGEKKVVLLF